MTMPIRNLVPSLWRGSAPARREPEHPFDALQQEMNRLFDSFFRGFDAAPVGAMEGRLMGFTPFVDVKEDEKEVVVKAELPGIDEKDLDVSLSEHALTIKGEKKEEKEDQGKGYYRMERSYGSFHREIPLPASIDAKKVEAAFKNGLLTVTLPKTEEARKADRKISVKSQ
jgi:HSP20 family protein